MGACPECENNDKLCTYEQDVTTLCKVQKISCSGNFSQAECVRLAIQEQRINRVWIDAMNRRRAMDEQYDQLKERAENFISNP
jgi:hypothetical protein